MSLREAVADCDGAVASQLTPIALAYAISAELTRLRLPRQEHALGVEHIGAGEPLASVYSVWPRCVVATPSPSSRCNWRAHARSISVSASRRAVEGGGALPNRQCSMHWRHARRPTALVDREQLLVLPSRETAAPAVVH